MSFFNFDFYLHFQALIALVTFVYGGVHWLRGTDTAIVQERVVFGTLWYMQVFVVACVIGLVNGT